MFLHDVGESVVSGEVATADIGELDTIVVPARDEGFQRAFIGEDRWYAIRIHSSMISQIKHVKRGNSVRLLLAAASASKIP